jgi:hypothetical protein
MIFESQVTYILRFFLSRNIRIAKDRAWDQTVASREHPPHLDLESKQQKFIGKSLGG